MKEIISAISKDKIKAELTSEAFLRDTNFGSNQIYVVNHLTAPNIMLEIGRLREVTFRAAGGGTGKEVDIDEFDTAPIPYKQLIVWDPDAEEILGGYRYIECIETRDSDGEYHLATTELFDFSEKFKVEYLPTILELGRSFVQPDYQSSKAGRKGLYALDNLWDGLGAIITNSPFLKYFYGKVTMYTHYNQFGRDCILYLLDHYFGDKEGLITPKVPVLLHNDRAEIAKNFLGTDFKEDYKILSKVIRQMGSNIPPLINSYVNLSPTMKSFGTAINHGFGGVEETGILVTIDDIFPEKKHRHIESYISNQ